MKRLILTYGAINTLIMTFMFTISYIFREEIGFERAMIVGYINIVLGSSMIYFAIASYKKNNGGEVSFGKAFRIGLYLALIASAIYALTWVIMVNTCMTNFCDEYHAYALAELHKSNASAAKIAEMEKEMADMTVLMKNPLSLFLIGMLVECLPVGLLISLISAAILRTKKPKMAL